MNLTLFTPQEATRLARELAPVLQRLVEVRQEQRALASRVEVLSLALAGATADNPDAEEVRQAAARRAELDAEIRRSIESIHAHGVLVKDLDRGLLDFYALAGDRLVFLCWMLGEPEVAHWHTLAGGFAARQPLDLQQGEERG